MKDYKIIAVEKSGLPDDKYGNKWYQIDVDGHDGPLLWKTAGEPVKGTTVFGHIELSSSGKSMLFKKDKKPDDYQPNQQQITTPTHISESLPGVPYDPSDQPGGALGGQEPAWPKQTKPQYSDNRQDDIRWMVCVKEASAYLAKNEPELDADAWADGVTAYANALFKVSAGPDKSTVDRVMGL